MEAQWSKNKRRVESIEEKFEARGKAIQPHIYFVLEPHLRRNSPDRYGRNVESSSNITAYTHSQVKD